MPFFVHTLNPGPPIEVRTLLVELELQVLLLGRLDLIQISHRQQIGDLTVAFKYRISKTSAAKRREPLNTIILSESDGFGPETSKLKKSQGTHAAMQRVFSWPGACP